MTYEAFDGLMKIELILFLYLIIDIGSFINTHFIIITVKFRNSKLLLKKKAIYINEILTHKSLRLNKINNNNILIKKKKNISKRLNFFL